MMERLAAKGKSTFLASFPLFTPQYSLCSIYKTTKPYGNPEYGGGHCQ